MAIYPQEQLFLEHSLSYLAVVPLTYRSFFFFFFRLNKIPCELAHKEFWGRSGEPGSTSPIPCQPVSSWKDFGRPLIYRKMPKWLDEINKKLATQAGFSHPFYSNCIASKSPILNLCSSLFNLVAIPPNILGSFSSVYICLHSEACLSSDSPSVQHSPYKT